MTKSYWRTGRPPLRRERAEGPSGGQVLRQLGIAALVVALWGVVFVAYLWMTSDEEPTVAVVLSTSTAVAAGPTHTPTLPPTDLPTPTTQPPTATLSPTPSAALATDAPTAEPSPMPGDTPTDTPPPTATEIPASVTPTVAPTETAAPAETAAATEADQVSFAGNVLPILENRCVKCHGGERTEEGLVLTTYADLMAGSWNGPVIVPGNADDSGLVEKIVSGEMPKRAPRLLPEEIRFITEWVNSGALDN